jgi:hypothetical protein
MLTTAVMSGDYLTYRSERTAAESSQIVTILTEVWFLERATTGSHGCKRQDTCQFWAHDHWKLGYPQVASRMLTAASHMCTGSSQILTHASRIRTDLSQMFTGELRKQLIALRKEALPAASRRF